MRKDECLIFSRGILTAFAKPSFLGVNRTTYMDSSIFRAYDIRGIYPAELNESGAQKIAQGLIQLLQPKKVALGRDARLSAPAIQGALAEAFLESGVDIVDLGMIATDMSVFAAGTLPVDLVVMVTASHNPKEWIGLKLTLKGGEPFGGEGEIQTLADEVGRSSIQHPVSSIQQGGLERRDILGDWIKHVLSFIDPQKIRPLKVVVDAGNGVAGPIVRELFRSLPSLKLIELFFEPDGNFPNHLPSPIEPENTIDLGKKVVEVGADLGIAFDGDADRVFLMDERGKLVTGSEIVSLVIDEILSEDPERIVLYNAICGWNVRDVIKKHRATAFRTKVGHGYIKKDMKKRGAFFAGEHSGHFFFKDNFNADSGLIAAVFVLQLLSKRDGPHLRQGYGGQAFSELLKPYRKYFQIPETNFKVGDDVQAAMNKLAEHYKEGDIDRLDGLTVTFPTWWFNVRPSSNEPLLRLNVEAVSPELLEKKKRELTDLIKL